MTHLFEDLTRAQLQDLAADLSTEVGGEVKASVKAINAALATLPDGGAVWLAERKLNSPSKAPTSPADATGDEAATDERPAAPKTSPQKVEGQIVEDVKDLTDEMRGVPVKAAPRPAEARRFAHLPDETPCLQLVSGPNSGLELLEIRQGDIVVAPGEDVARLFRRGVQHVKLTLGEARALVATGKGGRFNRKNSPSEEVA